MFETVYSLKGEMTLIIISHNINNLDKCDIKFKLEKGVLEKVS